MKRTTKLTITFLTMAIALTSVISTSASAHSGGTDSEGGHYVGGTNEYHWHHGYSAHQHEDRDGDGYPEYCPYKIQKNEGSYCGRADCDMVEPHYHANKATSTTHATTAATTYAATKNDKDNSFLNWENIATIGLIALIFGWPYLWAGAKFLYKKIVDMFKS